MRRLRNLKQQIQLVLTFLAAHALACVANTLLCQPLVCAQSTLVQKDRGSQQAVSARALPASDYSRLTTLALAKANAHLGPRMRNPRLAVHGWDPALRAILNEQREYLLSHPSAFRETSSNGDALLTAGLFSASCSSPGIAAINGRAAEAVFTPDAPDSRYRIEGCGFGREPGKVWIESEPSANTPGRSARPIMLQLDSSGAWSNTEINVHFEEGLSGIGDSAVRLVVQLADGRVLHFDSCHFVAARGEPTLFRTIPVSWVKLDPTMSSLRPIRQLEFLSSPPAGDDVPADAVGTSALVVRSDLYEFVPGMDVYDFSALQPGWVVESVQIQMYDGDCTGDVTRASSFGDWRTAFDARGFRVWWSSRSCSSFIPPVFHFDVTLSEYAVRVWVIGPVGTDAVDRSLGNSSMR